MHEREECRWADMQQHDQQRRHSPCAKLKEPSTYIEKQKKP